MKPLVTPVINSNGNSAKDLTTRLCIVTDALRVATTAMMQANDVNHGRNFQHLIKGGDWSEHSRVVQDAQQAWGERIAIIDSIRNEVNLLALAIQEQEKR
jgi:hypothetical protein